MRISVLCFGNSARGDDGLGELVYQWLQQQRRQSQGLPAALQLELHCEMQLAPEQIYDIEQADCAIFVDCHTGLGQPFCWQRLAAGNRLQFSSHALDPPSLLFLFRQTLKRPPPPCFLLGIGGHQFGLGAGLSAGGREHLQLAQRFLMQQLRRLTAGAGSSAGSEPPPMDTLTHRDASGVHSAPPRFPQKVPVD
ncbi:MAG: hydrogenase maturation protease [Pseudomonadota bacterium]|nr:hydrogenase maturation protease [Pseudomonadota bacterium]